MEIKFDTAKTPKEKPDFTNLTFGKIFTDNMFTLEYSGGKWHSPLIAQNAPLKLDPAAMVFHYGQAVFEGLKAYRTQKNDIQLFRPRDNFSRLNRSCERMCIPALDGEFLLSALKELIKAEKDWVPDVPDASLYIRPFVIATEAALGVHPAASFLFMIILSPVGPYYKGGLSPVKIAIEDEYVRAVRGGIGFTKASANYAISLKGQEKAHKSGYEQVLWLDGVERKYIEEVGAMNVFFKIGGKVVTPAISSGSILPGITRDSVIRLLKHWKITVDERKISAEELLNAAKDGSLEEAFGSGTAAVISPIGEFFSGGASYKVGNGETGELSKKLYDTLTGIQYGRLNDEFGWVERVV